MSGGAWVCPACNTTNAAAAAVCVVCGSPRSAGSAWGASGSLGPSAGSGSAGAGAGSSRGKAPWVIAGVVVAALVAVLAFVLLGSKDDNSDDQSVGTTTSTTIRSQVTKDVVVAWFYPEQSLAAWTTASGRALSAGFPTSTYEPFSPTPTDSVIYYRDGAKAGADELAAILGLPDAVQPMPDPAPPLKVSESDDIVVLLGQDWVDDQN